jgi:hypothetical protein
MSRRWQRWRGVLALAVVALWLAVPVAARADGSAEPPSDTDRVITIGPKAVVIQNQRGELRMYDDPEQQAPACGSPLACLGQVLGAYGLAAYITLDNLQPLGLQGERVRAVAPRLSSPLE